jgi:hypothetical protein
MHYGKLENRIRRETHVFENEEYSLRTSSMMSLHSRDHRFRQKLIF